MHFPDSHVVCFAHETVVISSFNNYCGMEQNFELICFFTPPCKAFLHLPMSLEIQWIKLEQPFLNIYCKLHFPNFPPVLTTAQ